MTCRRRSIFLWSSCSIGISDPSSSACSLSENAMRVSSQLAWLCTRTVVQSLANSDTISEGDTGPSFGVATSSPSRGVSRAKGHQIEVDSPRARCPPTTAIDIPPYRSSPHLRLHFDGYGYQLWHDHTEAVVAGAYESRRRPIGSTGLPGRSPVDGRSRATSGDEEALCRISPGGVGRSRESRPKPSTPSTVQAITDRNWPFAKACVRLW